MKSSIRERYLRDPVEVRLGGLAANLARVESFSDRGEHRDAVRGLLTECKHFIEWTAADVSIEIQVELVELQRSLARWTCHWDESWADPSRRNAIRAEAAGWSARILERSGLLSAKRREPPRAAEGG